MMNDYGTYDERATGALEPDAVLPAQFFAGLRRKGLMDGERRLMVAILEDAVHCFLKHVHATDPRHRQLFLDAEEWIMGTDRVWFFAFENVCEGLDLDPSYVREGLLRWKATQLGLDPSAAAGRELRKASVA